MDLLCFEGGKDGAASPPRPSLPPLNKRSCHFEIKASALNNDTYSSAKFMRTGFDRETSRNKSAQQVGELAKRELVIPTSCLRFPPGVRTTNDKHN